MPIRHCRLSRLCLLVAIGATCTTAALAEPAAEMSAERGKLIYAVRCASCHGIQGTGDGPAAPGMRVAPPDLTKISERAGGAFPSPRIIEVIMYGGNIAAHGSETMPVWGRVFSDEGGRGRAGGLHSRRAVLALKRYLETIQK